MGELLGKSRFLGRQLCDDVMLEVTIAMRYMLKDEKGKEQKNRQASILESEPLSQTWNVTSRCSW